MDIQCGCMFRDQSDDTAARENQRLTIQRTFFSPAVLLGHLVHIYIFTLHGNTHRILFFRLRNSPRKMTEIRGQTDSHSHLLFLAISPIPIPPLHQPSYQNKIVISTAEASPFYWRLSDVHVIMSDLGFDRPTRERLVLQGESMAQGHIPINRLPQLFCSCSPLCDR